MKKYINIVTILLCLFFAMSLSAQQKGKKVVMRELSAKVVDDAGNPMAGVLVIANEGADQTTTDVNGNFSIKSKRGEVLLFEMVGYQKLTMTEAQLESNSKVVVLAPASMGGIDENINLPYQVMKRSRTTGLVSTIDSDKEIDRDTRFNLATAINGKIPGTLGSWNIHGLGDGVIIVDGVKRDATYLNLQEVKSITVLKDAVSRMLYGADADKGVILVTTKTGEANKKVLKFDVEQGMQNAIAYPKFLDAASYMTTYNKAAQNDGAIANSKFSQTLIDNTANKVDPVLYPDNNYYNSDYVKNSTNFTNVYAEASGGNERTQYFMNLGWKHNEGWMKLGNSDKQDVINIRGKVDFEVNSWLKMKAEVVAIFDLNKSPNVEEYNATTGAVTDDFWKKSTTDLPNTQTLLIPTSRISNLSAIPASSIINGQYVMGGSSIYQRNLYGDMSRKGNFTTMNRYLQFNTGFDFNFNKITKGLTGKGLLSLDFTNKYNQSINNEYAVYSMGAVAADGTFPVTQIGNDKKTTQQTINQLTMFFDRTINAYLSLNYNRTFGKHAISAVMMGSARQYTEMDLFQSEKRVSLGMQANYTYDDRYIVEAGVLSQGSSKLTTDDKFGYAPSVGLAWIASNEQFLKKNDVLNYLKFRASYGVIQNDNWTIGKYKGYFLYEPNYASSNNYFYGNGSNSNTSTIINSLGNDITWQSRKEYVAGFDASLFKNKTWIEASYFNSTSNNIMTEMENNTPLTQGSILNYQNFNATVYQGLEVGVNHTEKFGKFSVTLGANYMYTTSNINKIDEAVYNLPGNSHLSKVGTAENSLWGLTSAGLYMPTDFDSNGKLVSTIAQPQYGTVKPGDIKYIDINGDGKINPDDYSVLGISSNNQQYSFDIDMKFNNWQLYVLGIGQMGGKGYTNSDYYWFKGNTAKYSEVALGAFDPLVPDANATYPRLSLGNSTNNYNNSSFWMYDKSNFNLAVVQLGYNFKFKAISPIKGLKIYARGNNLMTIAKDKKIQELNYASAPKNRVYAIGLIASF